MSTLGITVPFNEGETVVSFASRLAAANYVSLREFCKDMGLTLQKIVKGDENELQRLATLGGIDRFPTDHLVRRDDLYHHVNGETLSRACFLRRRLRYCPQCLIQDIREGTGLPRSRPYARLTWAVTFIRSCSTHNTLLREMPPSELDTSFEISAMIEAEMAKPEFSEYKSDYFLTPFETYIADRIWGRIKQRRWLDELPLYAAGKMCEVVGATILFGRQYFNHEIDEPSWRECAQAGFDVLGKNENAFRAFLRGLLSEFWESNGDAGGRKVYGRLYERLAHETEDHAYDNVREIMRDEALNALPLGPGDELFGPVTERRLHSIHSAAAAFKVNRKTLHKWAIASGIVPVNATEMSPDRVLVDSETVSELARKFNSRLTWTQARSYIRAPQTFWNTLSREGYIPPAIEIKAPQAGVNAFYLRSDLDGFVEKLSRGITLPFDRARQTASFARTIKQAHCSFREIVELLLKCALRNVTLDPAAGGLEAFRFDVDEVRRHTRLPDHGGLSVRGAARQLGISDSVLLNLIAQGAIACREARNPDNRRVQMTIMPSALHEFSAQYIPLSKYALNKGRHFRAVRAELESLGVAPTPPRELIGQIFYRRCDLP